MGTSMGQDLAHKEKPILATRLPGKPAYEEDERTVDNPYALLPDPLRDHQLPPEPKTQVVKANVRETPVEFMWARGHISHEEKIVADWFRKCCEDARIGGGVIDPSRIKVDTSTSKMTVTEKLLLSAYDLAEARKRLGFYDYDLLVQACDVGRSLTEIARRWYTMVPGSSLEREMVLHLGRRVRDALAILVAWRVQPKEGKQGRKIRGYRSFSGLTADANSWDAPAPTKEELAAQAKASRRRRRKRRR
jgi:hypothetical protein